MFQPSSPILLTVQHLRQRQTGECLAACAGMVLAYLGRPTAYSQLLKVLGIQEFGAPFPHLNRLGKSGIKVTVGTGGLHQLYAELSRNCPCIASVQTGELPHWDKIRTEHAVVVVGMDAHHIYLNDPAFPSAPIQVPLGDFDLAWLEQNERYAVITR